MERQAHRRPSSSADAQAAIDGHDAASALRRLADHGATGRQAVLFYEESDLVIPAVQLPAFRLPRLAEQLHRANGARARGEVVRNALRDLGFEWMVYGSIAVERRQLHPRAFLASYANPTLLHRYFSRRHHEVDLFYQGTTETSLPIAWTVDELAAHRTMRSDRARAYLDDLRASGVGSGVSFDVPGPRRQNERYLVSLLSSDPRAEWLSDQVLQGAFTLACCMHELLSRHALIRPAVSAARQALSARQIEILDLLAKGHSDRGIAEQLGLSAYAIDYHMRQLRRHFGVRNRVQLVNAAAAASIWPSRPVA